MSSKVRVRTFVVMGTDENSLERLEDKFVSWISGQDAGLEVRKTNITQSSVVLPDGRVHVTVTMLVTYIPA